MRCTGNGKLKAILFESINLHSFLKCGVVGNKFVMNIVRTRCRNVETASFLKMQTCFVSWSVCLLVCLNHIDFEFIDTT